MAVQGLYFGIRDLNLNPTQRTTLYTQIEQIGQRQNSNYPNELMQIRYSLDGRDSSFEAFFNTDHLTIQAIINRLAAIFGIDPSTVIPTSVVQTLAGWPTQITTLRRNGTNYIRFGVFGYDGVTWPTWSQSRDAQEAYIAANLTEWESATP